MNSTLEVINHRVSLRKYSDTPISQEHLDHILEAALRAPTAGNMMMYSILLIRDEEKKKKLSKTCDHQPFIAHSSVVMIFLADMQRLDDYFKSSNIAEFCEKKGTEYRKPGYASLFLAVSDALIAAQNAVIAAESLDIGSCYIGDIMENYEIHKDMLSLPDKVFPIGMLCFGYYPEDHKRTIKSRYPREYIVFEENYRRLTREDFQEMYRGDEEKVIPNNPHGAENFAQLLYTRKFGADFFLEMERSIKVILERWFTPSDKKE